MGWMWKVVLLFSLHCLTTSLGVPHQFPPIIDDDPVFSPVSLSNDHLETGDNHKIYMENYISGLHAANVENIEDEKLQRIGNFLSELLMMPWNNKGLPLLYIEDDDDETAPNRNENSLTMDEEYASVSPRKRSRYYRKYPWKRQNARQTYDAENRYLCQPSKEDVYRLLVALHETRQGTKGRTINFCNRKRPATAIFTNIRFLG